VESPSFLIPGKGEKVGKKKGRKPLALHPAGKKKKGGKRGTRCRLAKSIAHPGQEEGAGKEGLKKKRGIFPPISCHRKKKRKMRGKGKGGGCAPCRLHEEGGGGEKRAVEFDLSLLPD